MKEKTAKKISDAAKTLSTLGASKGGKARAKKLSPKERSEIASLAAKRRWGIPRAEYNGELNLGGITIPCYVLEDGKRVISHRGLQTSLSMAISGGANKTASFVGRVESKVGAGTDLPARILEPIEFMPQSAGRSAFGYEATLLADICDFMLQARKIGALTAHQANIAERCEILVRGFAKVGIVALVDEVTGYEKVRARNALSEILEAFIKDELGKWAKRFPDEFYSELFRLKGIDWPTSKNPPQYVGHWTNNLVYSRLAPGVLDELKIKTPKDGRGRRKNRFHQWLTQDIGHPKLQEHIASVIALMRACDDWEQFEGMLNRSLPKQPKAGTDSQQKQIEYKE